MTLSLWWLALSIGQAHPFGSRFATQEFALHLDATATEIVYVAEVPNPIVEMANGPQHLADQLRAGLVYTVDQQAVPLHQEGEPRIEPATDHTQQIALRLHAPALPPGRHDLALGTANLPEVPAYFAHDVQVSPLDQVEGSNLVVADGATLRHDWSRKWRLEDVGRQLTLVVQRDSAPWSARWEALQGQPRPQRRSAAAALAPSVRAQLLGRAPWALWSAGAVALLAGASAAALPSPQPRTDAARPAALALLLALVPLLADLPALPMWLAGVGFAVVAAYQRKPTSITALACFSVAAGLGPLCWIPVLAGILAAGLTPNHHHWTVAALVPLAILAGMRSLGPLL